MSKQDLAVSIENVFLRNNYQGVGEDGEPFIPNAEQIAPGLDEARKSVVAYVDDLEEGQSVTLMAGRLFLIGTRERIDVFVHHGELPLED